MHDAAPPADNFLLRALRPADRARVEQCLTPLDLPVGMPLYEAGEPMEHAYFPVQGIISMVSDMEQGTVEVGTVGREGMLGIPILLHSARTTTRAFMQVAGHGWRCSADELLSATVGVPAFSRLLHRYMMALFEQVAQSVACNRLHTLEARCARWLLMVDDRVGGDVLPLKQSFLADMLGVHRPAVTLAAGALQTAGLIRYSRGRVQILDRPALEQASCACYRIVSESFDRLRLDHGSD
jgi:CRP-like cAMP-binding protein